MTNRNDLKTWVEISKPAIKSNFLNLKKILGNKTKFMAVVKSNAYGHGMIQYAKEVSKLGADFLAVDDIYEAILLRKNGIKKPIGSGGIRPYSYSSRTQYRAKF